MTRLRRLGLALSVLAVGLFGQVVPAAASAHGPTAGSYDFTSLFAGFNFSSSDFSQPQIGISVNERTNVSKPLNGPSTTTSETDVFINFSGENGGGGCFIPDHPSDFTISSDLQSASLHTTITDTIAVCQGFPVSFQLPLTVDVVWTGIGPAVSRHATSHYDCGGFHTQTLSTFTTNGASATATLTPAFTDSFTTNQFTSLGAVDNRVHVDGTSPPNCAVGPGRGALSGSLAAGTYRTNLLGASAFFNDDASQTSFEVGVGTTNIASNPKLGPSTTTSETDLQITEISPDFFEFGCFVLGAPSDFTVSRDLQAASLHTVITDSTATCNGFSNPFSLPLTLDITWTGIAPLGTIRANSHSACLTNRIETSSLNRGTNASAIAGISALTGPLTTNFAGIGSSVTTTHAEGAIQPSC